MVLRTRIGLAVLFGSVLVLLLGNLGGPLLWEPDEGRHALIARGILDAATWRDVLLPHLGGRPYYDKPILFYWLVADVFGGRRRSAIESRVLDVLWNDRVLGRRRIDVVESEPGRVILRGRVWSRDEVGRAVAVAERAKGVREVREELEVVERT